MQLFHTGRLKKSATLFPCFTLPASVGKYMLLEPKVRLTRVFPSKVIVNIITTPALHVLQSLRVGMFHCHSSYRFGDAYFIFSVDSLHYLTSF